MNQNEFLHFLVRAADTSRQECFENFKEKKLVYLLKTSDEKTRQCFYPETKISSDGGFQPDTIAAFAELAIKYVCYGLRLTQSHGFCNAVQNCSYGMIGDWFKVHSVLGPDFLTAYLKQNGMEPLDREFQQGLLRTITGTAFITGEWVRNIADSTDAAKLLLAVVKQYMSPKYDSVLQMWGTHFPADTIAQLKRYEWFGKYEYVDTLYEYYLKDFIRKAVEVRSNFRDHEEVGRTVWSGVGFYGDIEYITHHEYDCGAAVVEWLNSGKAAAYGLRSSANPANHVDEQSSRWESNTPGHGCVAPNTRIMMADGSEKEICRIQSGDQVISGEGTVSVCSDELIHNDTISEMYGINEYPPFLSFEHAVMTQRGWCSLNPAVSNEINPHFHVKMLAIGDQVMALSHSRDGSLVQVSITVESIHVKRAKAGSFFRGCDLHFREGKNSYYANGILCLLNYPEITVKRIMDNLYVMPEADRTRFIRLVEENRQLFEEVFGKTAIHQFAVEVKNNAKL